MLKRFMPASLSIVLAVAGVSFAEPMPASTSAPAPDTYEAYQNTAKAALAEYQKLIPKPIGLADANAAQRDAVAPQAVPLIKKILTNLDQMVDVNPAVERPVKAVRMNEEAVLVALGDADTLAALDKKVKAGGPTGEDATNVLLRGQWNKAGKDAGKQAEVISAVEAAAKTQPKDPFLSQFIADIRPSLKDPAAKQKLLDVQAGVMDNPSAKSLVAVMKADDKRQSFEGKPMVLAGTQPDGKAFTTADWKGKVVLVDFWAVWCAPCRAELPRVKKVYEQYHDKGLEVLGVDSDYKADTVTRFTARDGLPWPQLFDPTAGAANQWHPLTKEHGIFGIPAMFLIDKNGVCRTVSAREDFEELIPKLLAE